MVASRGTRYKMRGWAIGSFPCHALPLDLPTHTTGWTERGLRETCNQESLNRTIRIVDTCSNHYDNCPSYIIFYRKREKLPLGPAVVFRVASENTNEDSTLLGH